MRNIFKKSLFIVVSCLITNVVLADDVTFVMNSIFDGSNLSATVTSPIAATVSTNTSKGNAKDGKLGSDGNYFQIVLTSETFSAAKMNGYINAGATDKNWGFQFSTDGGSTWGSELTQANDGNKTSHDITIGVAIPSGANGIRIIRRAGSATVVNSVTLTIGGGSVTPTVSSVTVSPNSKTLEINETQQLTATVDATPSTADKTVAWSTSNGNVATVSETGLVTAVAQGTATITATSNLDNTKSGTCTITVNPPATPIPVTAISIDATATVGIGESITLTVSYTPSDANEGKAVAWGSADESIATVNNGVVTGVAAGTTTITATSTTDPNIKATCNVTVKAIAVSGVSLDKTSISIQIDGTATLTATVSPNNATNKSITWKSDDESVARVNNGVVTGISEGTATITVTTVDGNHQATCGVSVTAGAPVPYTTLSLHEPGVYEARSGEGGYAGKLVENGGREYEVFYAGRWDDGGTKMTIHVDPADKSHGITKNETNSSYDAQDGWFKGSGTDKGDGFTAKEEFNKSTERCHNITSSYSVEMHIKGYDQFSLYGADKKWTPNKPNDCKYFKVFIDDVEQTMEQSTDKTIRRFDITTGEHVIKITHSGGEQSLFGGFSLRVAQVPRTQYLIGNDSVQTLLIGNPLANIYYYTKYNSFGETKLVWNGTSVEDINLQVVGSGPIGDTLKLSGNANCPAGDYNYSVVAYKNGTETNRVNGKFKVISDIRALTDTIIEAYKDAEIEPIRFRCYVYQQSEINFAWTSTTPAGLNGSFENGVFTIKGTPAAEGTYTFTISVGTKTYHGEIHIKTLDLSGTPIMYLYKNTLSYEQDGVYNYLIGKGQKLVTWKTSESFSQDKFDARYKLIIISEDVDASNDEVLNVIAGNTNIPVLNLQSYAYQKGRADMGNPYYGSVSNDGVNIYLQHPEHPIFSQFSGKHIGDNIQVLSKVERDGFLPVDVYKQNTLCLATAYTRSRDNYNENGERQTVLHEIPAADRNGKKYICFPLAKEAGENLTPDGKKLLDAIVDYLMNGTAVEAAPYIPEIKLNSLTIANKTASIDHDNGTATITLKEEEYIALDSLRAVEPQYTVADQTLTHVNINAQPSEDGKYDFRFTNILPVTFVVTDYINRKAYNFSLIIQKTQQGLDEVYNVGEWVNIFDIHGRKVATTNENIYQMDLPRGIYIIVTENGNTIKLSR